MGHRWYLCESHPGSTAGGIAQDADEYRVCGTFTRWGADRVLRWALTNQDPNYGYRIVSRKDWENR